MIALIGNYGFEIYLVVFIIILPFIHIYLILSSQAFCESEN